MQNNQIKRGFAQIRTDWILSRRRQTYNIVIIDIALWSEIVHLAFYYMENVQRTANMVMDRWKLKNAKD